eukprot:3875737-Prymnesium_polylepis.2
MACVMKPMVLDGSQKLPGIRKEYRARAVKGRNLVYFAYDRRGEVALLTQKLPLLRDYINGHLCEDKWEKITVTGLYENCDRVGGYHKNR